MRSSLQYRLLSCALLVIAGMPGPLHAEQKPHDFDRWEKDMQSFEAQDKEHPPQPGGVMFVGSSTIRMWKTDDLLGDLHVVNRGFGGSEMIDSWHFADRIIIPHKPKVLLVYAGSNDIAKGVAPASILKHFEQLIERVHTGSPETEIVFMSIKPTTKRWALIEQVREANSLVESKCADLSRVHYLDVHTHMLNADGEPEVKWLSKDGLHLNADGYVHLTGIVRPVVEQLLNGESSDKADHDAAK